MNLPSLPSDVPVWVTTHTQQVPVTIACFANTSRSYVPSGQVHCTHGDIWFQADVLGKDEDHSMIFRTASIS